MTINKETKLLMYLFSASICHQTHSLVHHNPFRKGWDYIEYVYTELGHQNSKFLNPGYLASRSVEQIAEELSIIFSENNKCTFDNLKERASILKGCSQILIENYEGKASNLLSQSVEDMYSKLNSFPTFNDPFAKKSSVFIKFARESGILTIEDPENLIPIMDYHIQRVLLRTGCVNVDPKIKEILKNKIPMEDDTLIRKECIEASRELAKSSQRPVSEIHDILWALGRSCCREKTLCTSGNCAKNPCSLSIFTTTSQHTMCILQNKCHGAANEDIRKLWQPTVTTQFY